MANTHLDKNLPPHCAYKGCCASHNATAHYRRTLENRVTNKALAYPEQHHSAGDVGPESRSHSRTREGVIGTSIQPHCSESYKEQMRAELPRVAESEAFVDALGEKLMPLGKRQCPWRNVDALGETSEAFVGIIISADRRDEEVERDEVLRQ